MHINGLRKRVDAPFAQPLIHTVKGVGYALEDRSGCAAPAGGRSG